MKLLKNTPIVDLKNNPIIDDLNDILTIETICLNTLLAPLKGDENRDGAFKANMFKIATKISSSEEVDLTAEEVSLLKSRIGLAYPALIVGRAWEILDPSDH